MDKYYLLKMVGISLLSVSLNLWLLQWFHILVAHLLILSTSCQNKQKLQIFYKANLNTGSVLEYAHAFTSAALDKYCSKWSAAPKTGFIDIAISKDFYRIYSGLQIGYLEESYQIPSSSPERMGDSVAWGGCIIIYLLGQQLHFELFDFSYQILNIAEVEAASVEQTHKNSHFTVQGWEAILEAMKFF